MNREKFKQDLDVRDFLHEEIIEGVRVVHTGMKEYIYDNGKQLPREIIEMYDANGNRFYSNCPSQEAEKLVEELKTKGKEAVIGPKAPARSYSDGKLIINPMEDLVGVYIVKTIEEKENTKSLENEK